MMPVYVLLGAAMTVLAALACGHLLFDRLALRFHRGERHLLAFLTGAALLHLAVFALAAAGLARKGVFVGLALASVALALRSGGWRCGGAQPLPPAPRAWIAFLYAALAVFGGVYLVNAAAPEASPDGSTYHLGLVARYLRERGFPRITNHMYASLSQGVEMLFLFAFSLGRHSAASLVHFSFLIWLPLALFAFSRRCGFPGAGAAAGIFVFASPVAGIDGTSAYNDVAVAAILFGLFYLLEIWRKERQPSLLIPIGLLAGFAFAAKYTAFLAVPFALASVALPRWNRWKLRPLLVVSLAAAVMILPWLVKNSIVVQNPFSPFLNTVFPNPYVHPSFEEQYRRDMRSYSGIASPLQIPLELTIRGTNLGGLLGPLFLLLPVALLAVRTPCGRRVLCAAGVFSLTYAANIGTRFLLPALPFLSLALALAFARARFALPLLAAFHVLASWPWFAGHYCGEPAWRLTGFPWRAALRLESEDQYLAHRLTAYPITRLLETSVLPGQRVLAFSQVAEAYTSKEVLTLFQSAEGELLGDILRTPLIPDFQAKSGRRFRFPARTVRKLRLVQTAGGASDLWSISELRVFHRGAELPRQPGWRLRAHPNPWDVQMAFDNHPGTRWRSWQAIFPGMYLEIDFGEDTAIDTVRADSSADQHAVRLRLDTGGADGRWDPVGADPEEVALPEKAWLQRAAVDEVKRRGIDFLVIFDWDFGFRNFRSSAWGLTLVGERGPACLYRINERRGNVEKELPGS